MKIIIPTELRKILSINQKARYRFKNLSAKMKRELISFVIEGKTGESRKCRAKRAVKVLLGMNGTWMVPC